MRKNWRFVYQDNQFWGECLPCTLAVFNNIINLAVVGWKISTRQEVEYAVAHGLPLDKLTVNPYDIYLRTTVAGFPWQVRLAHNTSSGHGLRLVCELRPELGNIADNQICLARDLGLMGMIGSTGKPVVDDSCIDASRISYAPRRQDIYFIDEEHLF